MKSKVKTTLFIVVSVTIFTRIMSLTSPKEMINRKEYAGDEGIQGMQVCTELNKWVRAAENERPWDSQGILGQIAWHC